MKIGILSFHASHNFGSMLQNYALQQFLMEEFMRMMGEEEGAAPPQWVVKLFLLMENATGKPRMPQ